MPGRYGLPRDLIPRLGMALLTGKNRSFRQDAIGCVEVLQPALKIYGEENIPRSGPCLVVTNHYARPGFRAWWLALAVSAAVPAEIHWLVTSAWTYPDRLRSLTVTPVSRWVLRRLSQVYSFTNLPPMPPDPSEVLERALAVRQVLRYARSAEKPLIGLSPEGGDFAAPGKLAEPPPGAGRFIQHLCALGMEISPVGIFEEHGCLCLRFGAHFRLDAERAVSAVSRDRTASQQVMRHIAVLIPG